MAKEYSSKYEFEELKETVEDLSKTVNELVDFIESHKHDFKGKCFARQNKPRRFHKYFGFI